MKSVLFVPNGPWVAVGIVCDCGHGELQNQTTRDVGPSHMIELGAGKPVTILVCPHCKREYHVHPQRGFVRVENA